MRVIDICPDTPKDNYPYLAKIAIYGRIDASCALYLITTKGFVRITDPEGFNGYSVLGQHYTWVDAYHHGTREASFTKITGPITLKNE